MIHLDGIDLPVRISKRTRILPNIIHTASRLSSTSSTPHTPRPTPTKRRIKHNILILKAIINRASTASIERYDRGSPIPCDRCTGSDIGGNGGAREEPDVDSGRFPLHGVNAAADGVEGVAVGSGGCDTTAIVARVGVTVGLQEGGGGLGAGGVDSAAGAGVQSHLVGAGEVYAFEDVDFAGAGPVGSEEPVGGPEGELVF